MKSGNWLIKEGCDYNKNAVRIFILKRIQEVYGNV